MVRQDTGNATRHDSPVVQTSEQDNDASGKKLKKPAPRKRQRGQKKPKPVQIQQADSANNDFLTTKKDGEAVSVSTTDPKPETTSPGPEAVALPPKATKKRSRKRKDGYDPKDLGAEVTVPDKARLDAMTKASRVDPQSVIRRPVSDTHSSPREREISQLKRRFGPTLTVDSGLNTYTLPFVPSDPDFPYELPELFIELHVPLKYPTDASVMKIKSGLEIGFARNIEREFDRENIGHGFGGRGLLGMLTWLDRNLERLLAMKKSDTVKIVRPTRSVPAIETQISRSVQSPVISEVAESQTTQTQEPSKEQMKATKQERNTELSKLRMIHPSQLERDSFDLKLSETLEIRLQVPSMFPIEPAWLIVLKGDESIELEANRELRQSTRGLARTLNWIAANVKKLHTDSSSIDITLTNQAVREEPLSTKAKLSELPEQHHGVSGFEPVFGELYSVKIDAEDIDQDSADSYSSGDDHEYEEDEEEEEDEDVESHLSNLSLNTDQRPQRIDNVIGKTQEKGTAINAVINMTHVALLEPISISLTLKCLRCKSTGNHIETVQSGKSADVQCPLCSSILSVAFRGQALHQANSRIGYLDMTGASVLDLGPGTFSPTCEKCDEVATTFKGLIAGQPQTRPCRACHIKQTVSISSTSFLIINSATRTAQTGQKDAQNLNIQRGKPLPNNGICKHFRKSNRWFRYSCCSRVYACPICHDELTDHPMELARFQICGWCSKESAIRGLKPCVHCGRDLTRRSRGGFWEGGQGVRDQTKMNKNDPRKHRKKIGSAGKKK